MKLSTLVQDLDHARILGNAGIEVRQVRDDSRAVEPGDVFVAVRGMRTDGHEHVAMALSRGAAAIVVERELEGVAVPQVIVARTADALGCLAGRSLGAPAERLGLVGITGTNGKTTTTYLIEAMLAAAGSSPGVVGTVNYRYAGKTLAAPYTTPTPLVLHQVLADMAAAGCTHAVLETSSAALAMDRLAGVRFQVAAFTNLSQDHLEVHGTMDDYRRAKEILFARHLAQDGVAVINIDDSAAASMIAAAGPHRIVRVSAAAGAGAEVRVIRADSSIAGIRADIATPRGVISVASDLLLGAYNVANLAMTVAIGEALGLDHDDIARGIAAMPGVPGRVERVANDRGLDILVDYAHTPDALRNVLSALRPLARRRLICVFGCGGDRDPSKRVKMGAAVAELADLAVVTSDNPRTEDAQAIIDMILPGVPDPFHVDVDRRTAIQAAIAAATPGDIVLIAGKGHEDYQILGTHKIHFDDREEAARAASLRWEFALADVIAACGGTLVHRPGGDPGGEPGGDPGGDPAHGPRFHRVIIDGRLAAPGDLYVAVRGERFDGHAFCAQAVAAGATGIVMEKGATLPADAKGQPIGAYVIEVPASADMDGGRVALGAIARWHRRRWGAHPDAGPVIGVTGSAGKTTTKELIAAALSSLGRVHATRGSLNNETGVPLTLLGLQRYHDAAVIEMGMRGLGQIEYLARMAEPDVGVVVNAGVAHVGVVGSADDIARGKAEMFACLGSEGIAVYPADDPRLQSYAAGVARRVSFGVEAAHPTADVTLVSYELATRHDADGAPGVDAGADLVIAARGKKQGVFLRLVGMHNAINATCAVAAALAAGVDPEQAVIGLARARPASMRGEIIDIAGRRVLIDCYNANPASMNAALGTLAALCAGAHSAGVAVLGDMLELGDSAAGAHRDVGALAHRLGIAVIALGELGAHLVEGARGQRAADPERATRAADIESAARAADIESAARAALGRTRPGDWILIKASRGMRLERVVAAMRAALESTGEPASRPASQPTRTEGP